MTSRKCGERSFRDLIIEHMVKGVPAAKKRFDRKTGWFRYVGEGASARLREQDIIISIALLYTADSPANTMRGSKEVLALASRAGDALLDDMDSEGRFSGLKTDGSDWGRGYSCWTAYYWLEAYVLLRDYLDPMRRRRWEKGLRLTHTGAARELEEKWKGRTHNIATWFAMSLVRAGQVFEVPEWIELGADKCRTTARHQHPDGYWPEGSGPTIGYNLTYVHSLGLYYRFTGDAKVLPALRRATRFHLDFTYPDGTRVETVDGRQRYLAHDAGHAGKSAGTGWPGFAVTPEGRGLVAWCVERLRERWPDGGLSPGLASAWQHVPDDSGKTPPQAKRRYLSVYPPKHPRTIVRRSGPWFVCLSGYLTPPRERKNYTLKRWIMDRAQHLSIWHEKVGLVVGGGNSKNDPARSTFIVWSGNRCFYVADSAELKASTKEGDAITLRYGRRRCTLNVKALGPDRIEVVFSGPEKGKCSATASFTMPFQPGSRLTNSKGSPATEANPLRVWARTWSEQDKGPRWFQTDACRVQVPTGSSVEWPVYPFNPYAINGAAPPDQAVARVATDVSPGEGAKRFVIKIV